ncbi:MAG: extracellular solute-binding protein [Rubrivivax sp.]
MAFRNDTQLNRRQFATLAGAAAASAAFAPSAFAQAAAMSFMSFTYAEEPNKPTIEKLLADFKTSSGVSVEPIGSAWGDMQKNVLLRQRSKTLPQAVQLQDRWLPSMAQLPEIVDLDTVIGRAELEAALDPSTLGMARVGGKTVGVPIISGSLGMVANKEVMAKAGIARPPVTLAEFRAALIAVRDKVPNSVPFAMATKNPGSIPIDVLIMVWAHGGRLIDESGKVLVNSAEGRAAMEFMAGLMKDRLIAPEIDRPDARRLFAQGTAAFYIDVPQARTFARSFSGRGEAADAFVLPMATPVLKVGDRSRSIEWGHVVSLFSSAPVAKDSPSAQWVRYLLSDAVQGSLSLKLGGLPGTRAGRAAPAVQGDAFLKAWAAAVGTTGKHEVAVWSNGPELSSILAEETQAALLGQKNAAAAMAAMHSRMEASMAKRT